MEWLGGGWATAAAYGLLPLCFGWRAARILLTSLCWVGMGVSLLLVLNVRPRRNAGICFVCFLSFVSAAQDFSGYQSDGMLLEAGFIALFFSPPGFRPGMGVASPAGSAILQAPTWSVDAWGRHTAFIARHVVGFLALFAPGGFGVRELLL